VSLFTLLLRNAIIYSTQPLPTHVRAYYTRTTTSAQYAQHTDVHNTMHCYVLNERAGLARGAYAVGYMYELGLGVPQDLEGALERYRGVALMASQLPSLDSAAVGEARGASLKALALAAQVIILTYLYCTYNSDRTII
jgi:TPR repeat protein